MMGHGFKADIEQMSKELPKEQDRWLIDLRVYKTSALKCARQLLELVSSNKSNTGPSLSTQTQAPWFLFVLDCNLVRFKTISCYKTLLL
jgi:hypothetical protein